MSDLVACCVVDAVREEAPKLDAFLVQHSNFAEPCASDGSRFAQHELQHAVELRLRLWSAPGFEGAATLFVLRRIAHRHAQDECGVPRDRERAIRNTYATGA